MVFLTLHMAYWRWDRNPFTDTEHVTVYIYRVTQVPTPEMIANNETRWSPGWNLTNPRDSGGNEWYVRENGMPVNFATLTLSFFLISALFHLCTPPHHKYSNCMPPIQFPQRFRFPEQAARTTL